MMDRGIVFDGKDIQKERAYEFMARLNPTSYSVDPATYLHPGHDMDKMKAGMPQSLTTFKKDERMDEMSSKFHNPMIMDHGKHRGDKPDMMMGSRKGKETGGE